MNFKTGQYTRLDAFNLYLRIIVRVVLVILGVLFLKHIFLPNLSVLMPFILALAFAFLLNPLLKFLQKKFKFHRKLTSIILILIVIAIMCIASYFLVKVLIKEIGAITIYLQEEWPSVLNRINNLDKELAGMNHRVPDFVLESVGSIGQNLTNQLRSITENIVGASVNIGRSVIGSAGRIALAIVTFFMALYFTLVDFQHYVSFGKKRLGNQIFDNMSGLTSTTTKAIGQNIKAQCYIALICFAFMLVAFLIAGRPYAFLMALILGIVDLLPIIGAIAVLLPWGIISLILGDMNGGIFLIIVGIVFFLLRRVIEPKLVGKHTGLHPLVTLMSLYIGLHAFGVIGGILAPTLVIIAIKMYNSGIFNRFLLDLRDVFFHLSFILKRPYEDMIALSVSKQNQSDQKDDQINN